MHALQSSHGVPNGGEPTHTLSRPCLLQTHLPPRRPGAAEGQGSGPGFPCGRICDARSNSFLVIALFRFPCCLGLVL